MSTIMQRAFRKTRQNCLEIHALGSSGTTRFIKVSYGSRCNGGTVQGDQRVPVEKAQPLMDSGREPGARTRINTKHVSLRTRNSQEGEREDSQNQHHKKGIAIVILRETVEQGRGGSTGRGRRFHHHAFRTI